MSELLEVSIDDGVAEVALNRPEKLNALSASLLNDIVEVGEEMKGRSEIRVVVLRGAGKAFSTGVDTSAFADLAGGVAAKYASMTDALRRDGRDTNRAQQASHVWREIPVPVIASLHGAVLGAGLQIALGADIRIIAPDAKVGVPELKWGLFPDTTGTQILPRLLRPDVAAELILSSRSLTGTEAVAIGLATTLSEDPLAAARVLAQTIASRNPDAVRAIKRLLGLAGTVPLGDGFREEQRLLAALIGTPNQREALKAAMESRAAVFTD